MTLITGNTYPVRDQLKALGGRWDSARKAWILPDDQAEAANALVSTRRSADRPPRTCKTCGCRINYGVYCGKCEFGR